MSAIDKTIRWEKVPSARLKKKVRQEQTLEEEKIFTASLKPYFTDNLREPVKNVLAEFVR